MPLFEITSRLKKSLKNCSKKEFFTTESIKESNDVNNFCQKSNYYFLVLLKPKPKNYYIFLLLLSGDIHPNPGPLATQLDDSWKSFDKSGLHILHLNINSLLLTMN